MIALAALSSSAELWMRQPFRRHTDLPPRASPRRNDPKGCGSLTSTPSLPSFPRTSVESPITRPHQG